MKQFCYYPVVFQIKCVFEKKLIHIPTVEQFQKSCKTFRWGCIETLAYHSTNHLSHWISEFDDPGQLYICCRKAKM